jgi:hypothetical protein
MATLFATTAVYYRESGVFLKPELIIAVIISVYS